MKQYLVGKLQDLPEGRGRAFKAGRAVIAVFRVDRKVYALANRCTHKGASLCEGSLAHEGTVVRCPWHNWSFDLSTGANCLDADERIRTYEVKVDGDQVIVCA